MSRFDRVHRDMAAIFGSPPDDGSGGQGGVGSGFAALSHGPVAAASRGGARPRRGIALPALLAGGATLSLAAALFFLPPREPEPAGPPVVELQVPAILPPGPRTIAEAPPMPVPAPLRRHRTAPTGQKTEAGAPPETAGRPEPAPPGRPEAQEEPQLAPDRSTPSPHLTGEALRQALEEDAAITRRLNAASLRRLTETQR